MRLWRGRRRSDQPQPEAMSDNQRLEQLLHQLADDIADHGDDPLRWSRQVREAADLIGRGKPWGRRLFLALFDPVGRPFDQPYPIPNPFTEQAFARTRTCDEAHRLARTLLGEHFGEENAPECETALRPWREGSTGKAVVYKDGTVVATEDQPGGNPHIADIMAASRPDEDPVARLAIRPDGKCAVYLRYGCDEDWLADRLHEHHPALHLEQKPPRG
jgi:hypothetical protein